MRAPSMPFYGRDFFGSAFVRRLPPEMQIRYLELLWYQWDEGVLPADPSELGLMLRLAPDEWSGLWSRVESRFPIDRDGQRRNARLEEIRAEMEAYRTGKKNGGTVRARDAERGGNGQFKPAGAPAEHPADGPAENQPPTSSSPSSSTSSSTASPGRVKGAVPAARSRFAPPTLAELTEHLAARGSPICPEAFIAHYESNGWMVGKRPMVSWKAAVVTWEKNGLNTNGHGAGKPSRGRQIMEFGARLKAEEERRGQG